jgi:DNA-binding transcriptional ArsR family regulator
LNLPNSGIIVPDMGKKGVCKVSEAAAIYAVATLSDALFTRTQQRVLGCLFGQPGRSFSVNELIHATRAGSGAVQRELARLAGAGLITSEPIGNQKRYRANPDSPIHDELVSIVRKTLDITPQRPLFLADPAGDAHDPENP